VESVYIAILSTFAITFAVCYKVFSARMERKLAEQRKQSEARMAELLDRMHHAGQIKVGSSLAGLTGITLWALRNCTTQFVRLLKDRDWNTTEPISELQAITDNEFSAILKLTSEFLSEARGIMKEFDRDQGLD
jgi:hypothetical protein